MFKNFKIYSSFGGLVFLILALFFIQAQPVQADTCSQNINLDFVVSSPTGSFVSNAQVRVYQQVLDVNGQAKPGTQVASASTDSILGTAKLSWRPNSTNTTYAIQVQPSGNNSDASFWYYNQVLTCGQSANLHKTLSGILFVLHNSSGGALTNVGFRVYSQVYDLNGNPQKQVNKLMLSPNSGQSGQVIVYLPQGSIRSMDRVKSDDYAFNLNHNNQNFYFYNISVKDGQLTTLNYFIPSLNVILQTATGALFPSGTQVNVYKQEVSANNDREVGQRVANFTLGTGGSGQLDLVPGLYVLGIPGDNGAYQYFFDVQVSNGQANTYTLSSTNTQSNSSLTTNCQNNSQFTLTVEDMSGNLLPGLKFSLYQQDTDAKGLPIAGQRVGGGTISNSGQASFSFRPDPRKIYALKIWDQQENLGEFWFFSAVRFTCDANRSLLERVPALRIILRDSQGQLERNHSFSVYSQEYDADHQPFFQDNDLVANLRTDGGGQAVTYLAPYNPYLPQQSGIYALKVRDKNGHDSSFYNIKIMPNKDYTFQASLSGVNGELRDSQSALLANKSLKLYSENTSGTHLSLGSELLGIQTDSNGKFSFEYPAGVYALVSRDDFNRKNVFWNLGIKADSHFLSLKTSSAVFSLTNPQGLDLNSNSSLTLYSLVLGRSGSYYQGDKIATISLKIGQSIRKSLASGTYLAVYNGLGNQQYGQAFYLERGEDYHVKLRITSHNLIRLNQSFYLPAVASRIIPLSSSLKSKSISNSVESSSKQNQNSHPSAQFSLATRLRGRILLQVESKGQAWYLNPTNDERYYLGRPADAFNVMRRFALGISNANFASLQKNTHAWSRLAGRILLKTQDSGRAYYFDPVDFQLYYLGRPADAFNVMRTRGLGISNSNLSTINIGN